MSMYFSEEDMELMYALRDAWDPTGRMNPGKMLPVRGCREVHTRPLAHSDEPTGGGL